MTNKKTDFEDYLREQHMANYTGTDDNAPDDFVEWTSNFDYEDWIAYGNLYSIHRGLTVLNEAQEFLSTL